MIVFLLQVLYLTEPDNWTAAAMFQATRTFVSNLNAKMAQRFVNTFNINNIIKTIPHHAVIRYMFVICISYM